MADADPRKTFNVHDAKTHLSRLMDRAHAGEEIILAKGGVPYVRIMPLVAEPKKPRESGQLKNLLKDVRSDIWFEPEFTEEELDLFEDDDFRPAI